MYKYGPLRCGMFIYDSIRTVVIIGALFAAAGGRAPEERLMPPLLMYAASNALFPLAALFLWVRPEAYKSYLPLYLAGKLAAAAAGVCWLLLSTGGIAAVITSAIVGQDFAPLAIPGSTLLLLFLDGISILGVLALLRRDAGTERKGGM
jgi:hypothetical protein